MGRYQCNNILFALTFTLLSCYFRHSKAQILPGKIYLELFYANPWHKAKYGRCEFFPHEKGCDVFFKICIWNGTTFSSSHCDVGRQTTETFEDAKTVVLGGEDYVQVPLRTFPPPTIRLRVEAWDKDRLSSHDHIVSFVSEAVELDSRAPLRTINLLKIDRTSDNEDVEIKVSLKLECASHYHGRLCEIYCQPDFKSYTCDSQGNRVCYPGFAGPMCNMKDYCFFEPCAPFAHCKNNEDGLGRTCYCGNENASECYEVRDVCDPSPCLNGGVCQKPSPHSQTFLCLCRGHWYGPTCSSMLSSCNTTLNLLKLKATTDNESPETNTNISVCENGGICVDHPTEFSHVCQCLQGWKGETCQIPDWTVTIVTLILVGIGLLSCACLLSVCIRHRRFNRVINVRSLLTSTRKAYFSKVLATKHIKSKGDPGKLMDECMDHPTVSKFEDYQSSNSKQMEATHSQMLSGNDKEKIPAECNDTYGVLGSKTGKEYPFKPTPEELLESEDLYSEPLITSNFKEAVEYRPPLPERSTPNPKWAPFSLSQNSSDARMSKSSRKGSFEPYQAELSM